MLDRLVQIMELVTREALARVTDPDARHTLSAALSEEKARPTISLLSFVKEREKGK